MLTKTQYFWTTYPPLVVNVVCERPPRPGGRPRDKRYKSLKQSLFETFLGCFSSKNAFRLEQQHLSNQWIEYFWLFLLYFTGTTRAIYTRKVARQYGICWLKKELFMVHGTLHIFLGIKLFVCQDRKLKLSATVWFRILWNFSKFQLILTNIQTTFFYG